jgi:hypothetical protein
MQSITTSEWHYIRGGSRGEQLFRCCDIQPETPNMAATDEGQQLCKGFRRELQIATRTTLEDQNRTARIPVALDIQDQP